MRLHAAVRTNSFTPAPQHAYGPPTRAADAHKGRFGAKCQTCHSTAGWKTVRFDHARDARWALTGAHAKAACQSCHRGILYQEKLGTDCLSCHRKDDVHEGRIRLERLVDMVCATPARIIGHYPVKGALLPGSSADLVLVDPEAEVRPEDGAMYSKSAWTPYDGWVLRGGPVLTMLRGEVIARDGEVVAEPGSARYVPGVPRPTGPIR